MKVLDKEDIKEYENLSREELMALCVKQRDTLRSVGAKLGSRTQEVGRQRSRFVQERKARIHFVNHFFKRIGLPEADPLVDSKFLSLAEEEILCNFDQKNN